MVHYSNYSLPAYEPNQVTAGFFSILVGFSLIAWIIQSIQARFVPCRMSFLLLISHLTIFVELVIRATLSNNMHNSQARYTSATILLAVGQRVIIVANYDFLIAACGIQLCLARIIRIGTILCIIPSGILTSLARTFSFHSETIKTSFLLRQISASIVLFLTIFFYFLWFRTRKMKEMSGKAIVLLSISSFASLVVAIFIVITSVPDYYIGTSQTELWFYIFQQTPLVVAQVTWSILHPKRILVPVHEPVKPEEV